VVWRAVPEDRQRYGITPLQQSAADVTSRCGGGSAPPCAPAAAPATGSTKIALISNRGGSHYVNGTVNGAAPQKE